VRGKRKLKKQQAAALARREEQVDRRSADAIAGELCRALQSLDRAALARGFQALRAVAPEPGGDLRRLLDRADSCLSLLTQLEGLAADLERSAEPASTLIASWLRTAGLALTTALSSSGPPWLAPLRHAVHLRWRSALERVLTREGPAGLAALCAAAPNAPKLLSLDVDLPGGVQAGLAARRQRGEAQRLLSEQRYGALAELLRARSRTLSDAPALAALWSLELWARGHQDLEWEEVDGSFLSDHPFETPAPPHRALTRLEEMGGEIRRRFPVSQRAEVARVLRTELLDLCEQLRFCEHVAGAALALLEHLPGDAGLLVAGVAGAVTGNDPRALRNLKAQIAQTIAETCAQAGQTAARDRPVILRLMTQIAMEGPWDLAAILAALRPFFSDDAWPEIAAFVAREMVGTLAAGLREESYESFDEPALGPLDLDNLRANLRLLRPALAGTPGFAAAEMALDCWHPDRRAAERRLKKFLAEVPGVEGPLTGFRLLERALGPWAPKGVDATSRSLAAAVIERIPLPDPQWQLWCPDVPVLALAVDSDQRRLLEEKIQQILASTESREGHARLSHALQTVQQITEMERLMSLPQRRRGRKPAAKKSKKKSPREPRSTPQLKLDLP
jgi:hypothetical protein